MKKNYYNLTFLMTTVGILSLLLFYSCWHPTPVEVTFAAGPDDTNTMRRMIDKFNKRHEGRIHVNWKEMSPISDENFEALQADLTSENPTIDVFASDVIWTGYLGAQGLAEDISKRFYGQYDSKDFVPAAMQSVTYDFNVYGVPWFTEASMIYYRKDLLDKYGFPIPPTTWDELSAMTRVVQANENLPYGYVFQGDKYEGGVTNACEFIWSAGGQITLDNISISSGLEDGYIPKNIITVDSRASENGFRIARSLIDEGIAPTAVSRFRERETTEAFMNGKALFMRGWPSVYGLLLEEDAILPRSEVGVMPLPVLEPNSPSFSCLGGWNLMLSAAASETQKDAAWKFIEYMVDTKQQKHRALKSGALPSIQALYDDKELLATVPVLALAKKEIRNARSRPITPYYMDYSREIAAVFNGVLKGELLPEFAVYSLQDYLENVQLKDKMVSH